MELWLGPAGSGKTQQALDLFRDASAADWHAVRYLVPTVGQKRNIEQLLLTHGRTGLFGDPVNIFFTFAQEVAQRAGVTGNRITDFQKHLLLKEIIRTAELEYFQAAAAYSGFAHALGEIIDELKVNMVLADELLAAATVAEDRGGKAFARKLFELGTLYQRYQNQVIAEELYDNEGIMWLAAEGLAKQPDLCADIRCLILDGFARLTPIQLHFLRALVPRIERTVILFDYQDGRSLAYHPVQTSLDHLFTLQEHAGFRLHQQVFSRPEPHSALGILRHELYRDRRKAHAADYSVGLFIGATPAHEFELIAREVRALLREGKLQDGTPVALEDIAIVARDADRARERLAHTFARYELPIRRDPPLAAHTALGRTLLAAFRLVRNQWKREDVLTLLKSGFLAIDPATAFHIDLLARQHALRERRTTWMERWPDAETQILLQTALTPLATFDALFHGRAGAQVLLDAIGELLQDFKQHAVKETPPLPDANPSDAQRYVEMMATFTLIERLLGDLKTLAPLLGGYAGQEVLDFVTAALVREEVPQITGADEGIPVLSVQSAAGEKFKVVFLCGLLQGRFPRHQRESAFLLDEEREETLRDLHIYVDSRRHMEDDEQYWFLHALSIAKNRVVLSYPQHDADGNLNERSEFIDAVLKVLPDLEEHARKTSFQDVVPPLAQAENLNEFYAGLAYRLRYERDPHACRQLAAAYTALPQGMASPIAVLFQRAQPPLTALTDPHLLSGLAGRRNAYSASELQRYLDCPFLWFASANLGLQEIEEEFSALDRGTILHAVLEQLYRRHQRKPGDPVHLEQYTIEQLWPEVRVDLDVALEAEPRFRNRTIFLRDIERESLQRMMQRFLRNEIERAKTRRTHPAFFEQRFGGAASQPLILADGLTVRGAIDRIDLADDDPRKAVVIDYKSSSAMTLKDLAGGKVVQACVYLLALERVFGFEPLGAEFIGLKQGDAKGLYREGVKELYGSVRGVKELGDDAWRDFIADGQARIASASEAMRDGHIAIAPAMTRCPDRCEFFALCRGDRFHLLRLQREASG